MKNLTFALECITPCLSGGATPQQQAEIRVPSIRGQLRWWLRTLGGSRLLDADVRTQENVLFGSASGNEGRSGLLRFRVSPSEGSSLRSQTVKAAEALSAGQNTARGYILFPLRENRRAVFDDPHLPRFILQVQTRKDDSKLTQTILALVSVFGHIGALGFRSRRGMGALAFRPIEEGYQQPLTLQAALACFHQAPLVVELNDTVNTASEAIESLALWLKNWRSHGRSPNHLNTDGPGFKWAKNDHDLAVSKQPGVAYRPALGLPILSKYGAWEQAARKGEGRFASPILLRPHKDAQGAWHALVVFVDAHKWEKQNQAFLAGEAVSVSLDLYEAMKRDPHLKPLLNEPST